ncbi:ribosome assembly cofactor RimP [Oribacterium sp. C9]|uniref:ribosome maturation factor RimP n=1 Tax=Oribacterium sp. C9 TaxID=1943579 RepID=UPI00098EB206|nr:ribosome assembly cofactor RimP [Oribacterium sp. C9]OON86515.1 ribosome assembly cofactor RimP [Oribacterium sp. C9]
MQTNGYTERVKKYLDEICPKDGYEVDSVTFTQENNEWYLRAFIYRADGVDMTVDDCAKVSRKLSKWLDKEDFIPEQYMLEVCSLGFKDHPGNADVEPYDVDAEASAEESTDNESEDIITGRG